MRPSCADSGNCYLPRAVNIEIINTGDELLLGFRQNTHQQWLGRRLNDLGYRVARQVSIPDNGASIEQAVAEALSRADIIIVTGGLGPTSDDVTRDRIAGLLGLELRTDTGVLEHLDSFFAARDRETPERVKVQAEVPDGATVLLNAHGTAPGLAIHVAGGRFRDGPGSWLVMLPGPPRELYPMFDEQVTPLLQRELPLGTESACVNLRTCGMGESLVEEHLAEPLAKLVERGLGVHFCLSPGGVDVRLACVGESAGEIVAGAEQIVRETLPRHVYGSGDALLEEIVVGMLTESGRTLALAESCTGGLIANRVTNVSGASQVFLAGLTTYSNEAKQKFLGVSAESLADHGAVSEAVACEMAAGALRETGADHALAVTGIAGPTGGTPDKPVGTVFIGLASKTTRALAMKFLNPYDRETFKLVTSQQALELLRRRLVKDSGRT